MVIYIYTCLFCPSVGAMLIRTHIIQSHFLLSSSGLCLEKYSFSVVALWAWMFFSSWQCRVRYYISNNVCQFTKKKKDTIKWISSDFKVDDLRINLELWAFHIERISFCMTSVFVHKMIYLARITNLCKNRYTSNIYTNINQLLFNIFVYIYIFSTHSISCMILFT